MERTLRESAEIGATHSTMSFLWEWIEPEIGEWDWEFFDDVIAWGEQYGIGVIPQLQYHRDASEPVPDPSDFARYAGAVVERYCGSPGFSGIVQVWNEPNIQFWKGTPEEYAAILDAAYASVKQECPDTIVVGFNIASAADSGPWLESALASSPRFDWFGWHTYGPPPTQSNPHNPWDGEPALGHVRAWLDGHGYADVPIFNTERGYPSRWGHRQMSQLLPQTYLSTLAAAAEYDVRGLTWYLYHDNTYANGDFGMVGIGHSWRPRPLSCAFESMTSSIKGCTYEARLTGENDSPDVQAHLLSCPDDWSVVALFAPLEEDLTGYRVTEAQRVRLDLGTARKAVVTDWLGRRYTRPAPDSMLTLGIGSEVTYVTVHSTVTPSIEVVDPGTRHFVPFEIRPESLALISEARSLGHTTEQNLPVRCFALEAWHQGLANCLGPARVYPAVRPGRLWTVLGECFDSAGPDDLAQTLGEIDDMVSIFTALDPEAVCSDLAAPSPATSTRVARRLARPGWLPIRIVFRLGQVTSPTVRPTCRRPASIQHHGPC